MATKLAGYILVSGDQTIVVKAEQISSLTWAKLFESCPHITPQERDLWALREMDLVEYKTPSTKKSSGGNGQPVTIISVNGFTALEQYAGRPKIDDSEKPIKPRRRRGAPLPLDLPMAGSSHPGASPKDKEDWIAYLTGNAVMGLVPIRLGLAHMIGASRGAGKSTLLGALREGMRRQLFTSPEVVLSSDSKIPKLAERYVLISCPTLERGQEATETDIGFKHFLCQRCGYTFLPQTLQHDEVKQCPECGSIELQYTNLWPEGSVEVIPSLKRDEIEGPCRAIDCAFVRAIRLTELHVNAILDVDSMSRAIDRKCDVPACCGTGIPALKGGLKSPALHWGETLLDICGFYGDEIFILNGEKVRCGSITFIGTFLHMPTGGTREGQVFALAEATGGASIVLDDVLAQLRILPALRFRSTKENPFLCMERWTNEMPPEWAEWYNYIRRWFNTASADAKSIDFATRAYLKLFETKTLRQLVAEHWAEVRTSYFAEVLHIPPEAATVCGQLNLTDAQALKLKVDGILNDLPELVRANCAVLEYLKEERSREELYQPLTEWEAQWGNAAYTDALADANLETHDDRMTTLNNQTCDPLRTAKITPAELKTLIIEGYALKDIKEVARQGITPQNIRAMLRRIK